MSHTFTVQWAVQVCLPCFSSKDDKHMFVCLIACVTVFPIMRGGTWNIFMVSEFLLNYLKLRGHRAALVWVLWQNRTGELFFVWGHLGDSSMNYYQQHELHMSGHSGHTGHVWSSVKHLLYTFITLNVCVYFWWLKTDNSLHQEHTTDWTRYFGSNF